MSIHFNIFKDKLLIISLLASGLYIFIIIFNLIDTLIVFQICKMESKKINNKVTFRFDMCLLLLKMIYKPYILLNKLRKKLKIRIDMDLIYSIILTIVTFLATIRALYNLVYIFMKTIPIKITNANEVYSYLSLTIVLTMVAYFPDKTGLVIQNILNRLLAKITRNKISDNPYISRNIIILLRPKLWVYMVSIFITIISSLEKISNTIIFTNGLWIQIKPIITESVVSLIVIDRFINLFKNHYKGISEEAKNLINHT